LPAGLPAVPSARNQMANLQGAEHARPMPQAK
jgi:hypothetical protein